MSALVLFWFRLPTIGFNQPLSQRLFRDRRAIGSQIFDGQRWLKIGIALLNTRQNRRFDRVSNASVRGSTTTPTHQCLHSLRFIAPQQSPNLPLRKP
jgi:hypothetical protein